MGKGRNWIDRPIEKFRGYRQPPPTPTVVAGVPKPPAEPPRPPPPKPRPHPTPELPPLAATFVQKKATGEEIINWIEERCYIPEGRLIGTPFQLDDWQRVEICRIYDNPFGTRRAILSFARKNGKTALAALLLLVHLCGPKMRPNSSMFSTAQSREQAALIFSMAAKIVRMSPALRDSIVIKDSTKELICPGLGTRYRALSAEASTAYGLNPVFCVHDELGQTCPRKQIKPLQNMGFQTAA